MTRDEAVSRIQTLLGYRSDKQAEIILFLQQAQTFYEQSPMLPWFLESESSFRLTTALEERVPLPTDFLREYEPVSLWYQDTSLTNQEGEYTALSKDDTDFLRGALPETGAPQAYAITGDYFRVFPTPDKNTYVLRMIYYKRAAPLTVNTANDWLVHYPDVLMGYAGKYVAASVQNFTTKAVFEEMEQAGAIRMLTDNEVRRHANRNYVMGGAD